MFRRDLFGVVGVSVGILVGAVACQALSLAEIRSRGEALAAEARAVEGVEREKALVERLGEVALAYIDESDRLQRGGADQPRAGELRAAFEAVHAPLDEIYRRHAERIDKMARAVMDADGDLEALYETADFQSSQAVAANALYYRNWLDLYGARVFDGARRQELLQACENGFSQFAVGEHAEELVDESLLGRGLCHLELGHHEWARRDFETVLASQASAERKAKARLALLDAWYRSGERARAIAYARELLAGELVRHDDVPLVRFYELQALLDSADRASGSEAERLRREAGVVVEQLRRAGGGWGARVDALLASNVEDPKQWAGKADSPAARWQLAQLFLEREDCAGAEPLLEALLADADGEAKRHHGAARYWLAVCRFRGARFDQAATILDAVLEEGDAPFAADARYLRFKALEALMAVDEPAPATSRRYLAALRDLLDNHPEDARANEARYRLAEYLQATGEFDAAVDAYARVGSDAALALRAAFGSVQSRFELLRREADPSSRAELIAALDEDLALYDARARAYASRGDGNDLSSDQLEELDAKMTLLRAVYATMAPRDDDQRAAEVLVGFGERFAAHPDLVAQAARLRLGALLRLERFADAEVEVERNAAALRAEGRGDTLRRLASSFAVDGRMSESPDDAASAARVAVALHGLADAIGGAAPSLRQRVAIAQLREKAGHLAAAAAGYRAVLAENPNVLAALRGLARIAEAQGAPADALAYWAEYTEKVRGGGSGWFRGQYEQARLQFAAGNRAAACERLTALRTAMPGLQDEELRAALQKLHTDADC